MSNKNYFGDDENYVYICFGDIWNNRRDVRQKPYYRDFLDYSFDNKVLFFKTKIKNLQETLDDEIYYINSSEKDKIVKNQEIKYKSLEIEGDVFGFIERTKIFKTEEELLNNILNRIEILKNNILSTKKNKEDEILKEREKHYDLSIIYEEEFDGCKNVHFIQGNKFFINKGGFLASNFLQDDGNYKIEFSYFSDEYFKSKGYRKITNIKEYLENLYYKNLAFNVNSKISILFPYDLQGFDNDGVIESINFCFKDILINKKIKQKGLLKK